MIRTVLFDLDGVIRHFDVAVVDDIERRHALAPGSIHSAAFAPPLHRAVTTGRITRGDWIAEIGAQVGAPAAREWGMIGSWPDSEMLDLNRGLRAAGIRTAVLTNGTDRIPDELRALGLSGCFDAIFNTAEIGVAKPDAGAFRHVLDALRLHPRQVFFTDDSPANVAGAVALGMRAHHFTGIQGLRAALASAGVRTHEGDASGRR